VVYDALVNRTCCAWFPGPPNHLRSKRAKDHALAQEELNQLLVAKPAQASASSASRAATLTFLDARRGGRGIVAAGIRFEVVPGISSVVAGPSYAGIPLTHREHCSSFTVITGHEDPTKEEAVLDYEQLARTPGPKSF